MRTLPAILPARPSSAACSPPPSRSRPNGEHTKLNLGSADDAAERTSASRVAAAASSARSSASPSSSASSTASLGPQAGQGLQGHRRLGHGPGDVATLPLGTNRALHLVRAGGEIVLLGAAEHSVTPIRRYSEDEARALGLLDAPRRSRVGATLREPRARRSPRASSSILRSKTVVK